MARLGSAAIACFLLLVSLISVSAVPFVFTTDFGNAVPVGSTVQYSVSCSPAVPNVTMILATSSLYTVVPPTFNFSTTVTTINFTFIAGSQPGSNSFSWTLDGPDAIFYFTPFYPTKVLVMRTLEFVGGYAFYAAPAIDPTVGVTTDAFALSLSTNPNTQLIVTPSSSPFGAAVFTPTSFTFTPTSTLFPFTFSTTEAGPITLYYTLSGPDAALYGNATSYITSPKRQIVPSGAYTSHGIVNINTQSEAISLSVNYPPPTGITLTPYSDTIVFTPSSLSFTPTQTTTSFTYSSPKAGSFVVSWALTGADAAWYADLPNTTLSVGIRTFTVTAPATVAYVVGQTSDDFTISTQYAPENGVTLTISQVSPMCSFGNPVISPSVLTFTPSVLSQSFSVQSNVLCNQIQLQATVGGVDANSYAAPSISTKLEFDAVTLSTTLTNPNLNTLNCGDSFAAALTVSSPPPNGFSVGLSAPGATITPSSISFTPTVLSAPFTVTSNYLQSTVDVHFQISGTDSPLVGTVSDLVVSLSGKTATVPNGGQFTTPGASSLFVGTISNSVPVMLNAAPASGITVTPSAPGLTFSPSSLVFGPTDVEQFFTVTSNTPGTYVVNYALTGADAGCFSLSIATTSITVSQLSVQLSPSTFANVAPGVASPAYTVFINNLPGDVTLVPVASDSNGNVLSVYTFQPATISLTQDKPFASLTFSVSTARPYGDLITFVVSGTVASYVSTLTATFAGTKLNTFNTPSHLTASYLGAFVPTQLVAGVESPFYIVSVSDLPLNSVSLRPSAPLTTFDPEVLSFNPTTSTVAFTITPQNGAGYGFGQGILKTITWTVAGTDAALYSTPATNSFLAISRQLLVASSSALTAEPVYVNTPISFTVTTPYAPSSPLTITPSGDAFKFSPSSIVLDSTTTAAAFVATPIIVGSSLLMKFVVSGDESSLYLAPGDLSVTTTKANFQIEFPKASAGSITQLAFGVPSSLSFSIQAVVPPPNEVTVTVYSQQVVIPYNTFTFTPTSTIGQFSLTPLLSAFAASPTYTGVALQFVVSGTDVALFSPIAEFDFVASIGAPPRMLQISSTSVNVPTGGSSTFTVTSSTPPVSGVTITPSTPDDPDYVFTPASATLSSTSGSAVVFSVSRNSASIPRIGTATVILGVTGVDAYLYANNPVIKLYPQPGTISTSLLSSQTVTVGKTVTAQIMLSAFPLAGLVVEPYVVEGQPVTFASQSIAFSPNQTVATFSFTPAGVGNTRISFAVSGGSAPSFSFLDDVNLVIVAGVITLSNTGYSFTLGGTTKTYTLTLNTPVMYGLNITGTAPGFMFSPPTIALAPGATIASFTITATSNFLSGYITYTLSGPDASFFTIPCTATNNFGCGISSGEGSVSAYLSASGYLQQSITFQLSTSTPAPLTITPTATGVTFVPPSVTIADPTTTSAAVSCIASAAGSVNIMYTLSGPGAQYYTAQDLLLSPVTLTFSGYPFSVTAPQPVAVGAMSGPVILSVDVPYAVAPVLITPQATIPGVVFQPANVTLSSNVSSAVLSAMFRYQSSTYSSFAVNFQVSGPGASAYATIPPVHVQTLLGSFEIPTLTNYLSPVNPSMFIYGVNSSEFKVYARSVPAQVSLQLVSESFDFFPSILRFNALDNTAGFVMTPKKLGPAVIDFNIIGDSAAWFTRPATYSGLQVTYKVNFPVTPQIPVGQWTDQVITVEPTPQSTFAINLQVYTGVGVTISPSRVVFTPLSSMATVSLLGSAPTIGMPYTVYVPGVTAPVTSALTTIQITGRDATESSDYVIPLVSTAAVIVTPGTFTLQHPRYQMDIQTTITVQISTPPRSDVVLTLFGNNMQFVKPYVVFVPGGPTSQDVTVTPRHTTSYELDYESFKVDYVLSGTNAGDYITPVETYHYIAIPQGYIAAIVLVPLAVIVLIVVAIVVVMKRSGGKQASTSIQVSN